LSQSDLFNKAVSGFKTVLKHSKEDAEYYLRNVNGLFIEELCTAPQKPVVTDSMALVFHKVLNDGGIGHSDLEEIKVSLRATLGSYESGE